MEIKLKQRRGYLRIILDGVQQILNRKDCGIQNTLDGMLIIDMNGKPLELTTNQEIAIKNLPIIKNDVV